MLTSTYCQKCLISQHSKHLQKVLVQFEEVSFLGSFSDDVVFQLSSFHRVKIYISRMLTMLMMNQYSNSWNTQPDTASRSRTDVHWHLSRNAVLLCHVSAADQVMDVSHRHPKHQVVVHQLMLILPPQIKKLSVQVLHAVH